MLPWPARWFGRLGRLIADPQRAANPGVRFARALEQLGPAYVKLGQFLATRGDILDPAFVEGLATLKDKAEPFSLGEAKAALRAEFGEGSVEELFAHLGPAVAAASVAQVHKLPREGGPPLAIKILRPGVEAKIARDMSAFRLGAAVVEAVVPAARRLRPRAFVETLSRALTYEMDLRLEAANATEMAEIAKTIDGFGVPKVDWTRSGKRVLAIRWLDGAALSNAPAVAALQVDRKRLAVVAIQAFLTGALKHGVFHADMHEGNLFASPSGELIAIDFGIVGRIGENERRYLAEILYGFIRRDYTRIAEVHFEAGYVPSRHNVSDFAAALRAVGEPIWGKRADEVSMGRLLLQLFEVTELFDMALRPELVLLQKTMVQVEGVARGLDPHFDMWATAGPVVETWIRRELGPRGVLKGLADEAWRLRAAARRLPEAVEGLASLSGQTGALSDTSPTGGVDPNGGTPSAAGPAGLQLSDDSVARIAAAQAQTTRWRFWALASLLVATFAALMVQI